MGTTAEMIEGSGTPSVRLALRPELDITPPTVDAPYATIYNPRTDRYHRIREREYAALELLDGSLSITALEGALASDFSPRWVRGFVDRLGELELVADPAVIGSAPDRGCTADDRRPMVSVEALRPTMVRVRFPSPERVFGRLDRLYSVAVSPAGRIVVYLLVVWAFVSVVLWADRVTTAMADAPAAALVLVMMSTPLVLVGHELAHGLALRHAGGRVRSVGVMLMYFVPAAFCDVTDSWRLHDRRQRAAVALAGPLFNLVLAGLAGLTLPFLDSSVLTSVVTLFISTNIGLAIVNLVPIVKFDGYWALVALLDEPNLMSRSRASLSDVIHRRRPRGGYGLVGFGLGTLCGPPALVAVALIGYRNVLVQRGPVGVVVWFVALAAVCVFAAVWAHRRGLPRRLVAVVAALALIALVTSEALVDEGPIHWLIGEPAHVD